MWLLFSFKGYTSNEFLFSFRGGINRAKYGYAAFASSAFCGVLLGVLAFALGRIFGASVKSVHLNFLDIVPFNITFGDSGAASTETLPCCSTREELRSSCSAPGSWRPPRSSGSMTATKAAGGWSGCSSLRTTSTDLRIGFPIAMRWPSSVLSHSFFASGACRAVLPERDGRG
jgi:hypothetical protein